MSWNILLGGCDGQDRRRFGAQAELIRAHAPDVLLLQECKDWLAGGMRELFELEFRTGLRGFLGEAVDTRMSTGVFIGPRLRPLAFGADAVHFHHVTTMLAAAMVDGSAELRFGSVHLCPYGPEMRVREAYYLAAQAAPDSLSLLGGDFNTLSPHDPEPQGLSSLAPRFRARHTGQDGERFDRRPHEILEQAGWVDLGRGRPHAPPQPTVPSKAYAGGEFVPFRCDYLLATPPLAQRLRHFEVLRNDCTETASDHLPLLAEFEL